MKARILPLTPCLALATSLLLPGSLRADFANGDMSAGAATPTGWALWVGTAPVTLTRDTAVYFSPPSALRVTGEAGAYGLAYASLPAEVRLATIRGYARLEGAPQESVVAIQIFDATNRQLEWKNLVTKFTAGEWMEFEGSYSLPASATRANLVVNIRGAGNLWLDDIVLSPVAAKTEAAAGRDEFSLTPSAAGWRTWIGKGDLVLSRQPGSVAEERTALSARGVSAESNGTAFLGAKPPAGSTHVSISAQTRRDGLLDNGVVALVFQDADRKQIHWVNLAIPDEAWTPIAHEEFIPAGTHEIFAVLNVRGTGSLLLDRLQFTWR